MTKYWKTVVQKDGSDVNLYVATTEEGIRRDHAAGSSGSLISSVRHLRGFERGDHEDLAAGAFHFFMGGRGFTQADPAITEVSEIPRGLRESIFGGPQGLLAVTVYY